MKQRSARVYLSRSGWKRVRRALLVLATGMALVAGEAAERIQVGDVLTKLGYEAVELRRTGEHHLFLFGRVNGRRRSCLVDTGWSFATVSTNTAARLSPPRIVEQLALGPVLLTNQPVVPQDMRINGRPAPYDVVLGCDFLIRHHAVIDCANNRLFLRRSAPAREEAEELQLQLSKAGLVAVPMKRHRPPALTCEVTIGGQPVAFLIDSGAVWSCLDLKTAQALALSLKPSPRRIMGSGAVGQRAIAVVELRQIGLGAREIRHWTVAAFSLADWGMGPNGKVLENVGGILGGGELAGLGAVIDCVSQKLWLRAAD
jgi:predicted aspartyl protease